MPYRVFSLCRKNMAWIRWLSETSKDDIISVRSADLQTFQPSVQNQISPSVDVRCSLMLKMKTPCTLKKSGKRSRNGASWGGLGGKFAVFNGPQPTSWIGEKNLWRNQEKYKNTSLMCWRRCIYILGLSQTELILE